MPPRVWLFETVSVPSAHFGPICQCQVDSQVASYFQQSVFLALAIHMPSSTNSPTKPELHINPESLLLSKTYDENQGT
jgi:hypothetical protein